MKRIPAIIAVLILFSCASADKKNTGDTTKPVTAAQPQTGWADNDTYTVHVSAETIDEAIKDARHQILKDIVNVRMLNNSRYTDITVIQEEFKKPLENGSIIKQTKNAAGIEIWYQIRDQGLKEKFERK